MKLQRLWERELTSGGQSAIFFSLSPLSLTPFLVYLFNCELPLSLWTFFLQSTTFASISHLLFSFCFSPPSDSFPLFTLNWLSSITLTKKKLWEDLSLCLYIFWFFIRIPIWFWRQNKRYKWVSAMAAPKPEEISHPPMDQLQGLEYCIDSNPSWGMADWPILFIFSTPPTFSIHWFIYLSSGWPFSFLRVKTGEAIALGFQHYILALGTAVMIPSFLVPLMGGNDVSKFSYLFIYALDYFPFSLITIYLITIFCSSTWVCIIDVAFCPFHHSSGW